MTPEEHLRARLDGRIDSAYGASEAVLLRQAEESTRRQEAELAASRGEEPSASPALSAAEEHLRARLDRAGEKEPEEREEVSSRQERAAREPEGGGRGMC